MTIDIGIASLADMQAVTVDGAGRTAAERIEQIVSLGELADRLGLGHFGVGEHHNLDFSVSSCGGGAGCDCGADGADSADEFGHHARGAGSGAGVSGFRDRGSDQWGRAEIAVGRSAYPEPFTLFGVDMSRYDELFAEKLELLLRIRSEPVVTWRGEFRAALEDAAVTPRAVQDPLPVWLGVGGTPSSAVRAGTLGLPMILGYIGGPYERLLPLAEIYREAGERAGHADKLRLGVALHYFGAPTMEAAAATYPYYYDFLRPKHTGGGGFIVTPQQFQRGLQPGQHLMIGTSEYVTAKLAELHDVIRFDRVQALVDWGGLPRQLVEESMHRLGAEIAPSLRRLADATRSVAAG